VRTQSLPRLWVADNADIQQGERLGSSTVQHRLGTLSYLTLPDGKGHGPCCHGTTFFLLGSGDRSEKIRLAICYNELTKFARR
jgi:hypothetical protein